MAAVGLLVAAVAEADDSFVTTAVYTSPVDHDGAIDTVACSASESTRKLPWQPTRPTKEQARLRPAVRVAQQPPRPVREPIPLGQLDPGEMDPFDDPFGDFSDMAQLTPPGTLPGDRLLEGENPQPNFQDALPGLLDVESSEQSQPIDVPSLEDALAAGPKVAVGECPKPEDLKRIGEITYDITAEKGRFPTECGLGEQAFQARAWAPTNFTWKASGLCHKPLYFEDVHLERYGHSWGPYLQPVFSGAHFFLNVPALPYFMGVYPPGECMYTLGYYRPGNCAPYMIDPLPLSIRGALTAGAVYTGLIYAIP